MVVWLLVVYVCVMIVCWDCMYVLMLIVVGMVVDVSVWLLFVLCCGVVWC